jgi:DNA-binding transcriptional ArsR family regulator
VAGPRGVEQGCSDIVAVWKHLPRVNGANTSVIAWLLKLCQTPGMALPAARPLDTEAALRALAHPGRRRVLQLVSGAAWPSGKLAETCGWTKPATSQHLKVLRDAGLIEVRKQGTRRLYRAREERLAELRAFLDGFWAGRLRDLADQIQASDQDPGSGAEVAKR